jgi:hypothetical protein
MTAAPQMTPKDRAQFEAARGQVDTLRRQLREAEDDLEMLEWELMRRRLEEQPVVVRPRIFPTSICVALRQAENRIQFVAELLSVEACAELIGEVALLNRTLDVLVARAKTSPRFAARAAATAEPALRLAEGGAR